MFMEKIEAARVTCDLFAVTKGFDGNGGSAVDRGSKPRTANEAEARAYADFIRRKNDLPELGKAELQHKGGTGRWATSHFHYVGATYGEEISRGEYEAGAYSVLFPGANQMRAAVTFETLDESGDVLTSSTMPVEPKKGGIVWGKDDVRKACGPIVKVKAARTPTPRTRKAAPTVAEQDKRRRAVMRALKLRAELRREREISQDRWRQIMGKPSLRGATVARQMPEAITPTHVAQSAPDAILIDLAAAERMMRGEDYVAPPTAIQAECAVNAPCGAVRRSSAHERAIRRAWAERKARREAEADWEAAYSEAKAAQWQAVSDAQAAHDRTRLAESIAEDHLRMREQMRAMLAALERRAEAAEAENAELWAEIEKLTAPAPAFAA